MGSDKMTADAADRAIVQLAGCLMAAEGNTELDSDGNDTYGWSPAYQAIVELRRELAEARAMYEASRDSCVDAEQQRDRLAARLAILESVVNDEVLAEAAKVLAGGEVCGP